DACPYRHGRVIPPIGSFQTDPRAGAHGVELSSAAEQPAHRLAPTTDPQLDPFGTVAGRRDRDEHSIAGRKAPAGEPGQHLGDPPAPGGGGPDARAVRTGAPD